MNLLSLLVMQNLLCLVLLVLVAVFAFQLKKMQLQALNYKDQEVFHYPRNSTSTGRLCIVSPSKCRSCSNDFSTQNGVREGKTLSPVCLSVILSGHIYWQSGGWPSTERSCFSFFGFGRFYCHQNRRILSFRLLWHQYCLL